LKIGLYGGTFDPVHLGHLIIAQFVKEELSLDRIYFIPTGKPPHKSLETIPNLRFEMLQLAVSGNASFHISDIELSSSRVSYTVDTVAHFKNQFNLRASDLHLIVGSDSFIDLPKWRSPEEIMGQCQLVVFPRNRLDWENAAADFKRQAIYLKEAPIVEISSTRIRAMVKQGRAIRYLVPDAVERFVVSQKLYQ
jgi:nicotinate-nucleotide adenylyltransferase